MTTHCGALIPKVDNLSLDYVFHVLNKDLKKFALGQEGQNKRVTVNVINNVEIVIPIKKDGTFDLEKQKELAKEYQNILLKKKNLEDLKQSIFDDLDRIINV